MQAFNNPNYPFITSSLFANQDVHQYSYKEQTQTIINASHPTPTPEEEKEKFPNQIPKPENAYPTTNTYRMMY